MNESATTLRDAKARETERALASAARRLTIEHGLAGFTVEDACAEVGVSRRTFFNYFASKENAVLGFPLSTDTHELDEAFVASDGPLMEALVELLVARFEYTGRTHDEVREVIAAAQREPKLIAHAIGLIDQAARGDIRLVERREGWPEGDMRAEVAIKVLGPIVQPMLHEVFEADEPLDFRTLALRRLEIAYTLFTL